MNSKYQLELAALNVQVILLEAEIEALERLIAIYVSPDLERSRLAVALHQRSRLLIRRSYLEEEL